MLLKVTQRLPALVYFAWAYALLFLLDGYRYAYYLQPKFWFIIAIGLVITIFYHLSSLLRAHPHPMTAAALIGQWSRASVLLLPLVFLLFTYGQSLGAHAYEKRALSAAPQLSAEGVELALPLEDGHLKSDPDLLELLLNEEAYDGATISTIGKVYWRPDAPENSFQLYRFIIVCCAADAQPAGLLVRGGPNKALADDDWVRVSGVFHRITVEDRQEWCLDATTIEAVETPAPRDQYLQYSFLF